MSDETPPDEPYKPLPLQLDLPARKPEPRVVEEAVRPWTSLFPERAAVVRVVVRGLAGAGVAAVVAAIAIVYALPWYVRGRCADEAQAHGVTLAIDEVKVDGSGFRLLGVTATVAEIPGARLVAPEVEVETKWLQPSKVSAKGLELTLTGRWSTVAAALDKWLTSSRGVHGSAWASVAPLITDGSRIVWLGPIGENARVEAAGVHADISWPEGGAVVHASSENVKVAVPGNVLGPWRVDIDRAPASSRTCVALDPGVPNTCTVLVVGNDEATTDVQVTLARSPVARLGIPSELLGVGGRDLQLDASVHYSTLGPARAELTAKGGLHGVEARGIPRGFDVSLDASASGDPRSGIDVKQARLAVGPLVGNVRGMLKRFDDGFRVDLAWSGGPAPCTAFDTPLSPGQPFDIAYELRKLAQGTGMAKVSGSVSAQGMLAFDSRDLGSASVSFTPEVKCQVALFGAP
ncbi:MAG: hypothetical protein ACLP1X_00430 [Polyangiaceae bacterium]